MAAPRESFPEVLTEGWLWWLSDKELKKTKYKVTADGWKPYYFYMTISACKTHIRLYKKPPKSKKDKPYVTHVYPEFQLHKRTEATHHQPFICQVTDLSRHSSHYAFENEARRDSFAFFMITQRRLPEKPTAGRMFSVKPDDSAEHRKIGSRGSNCLLHVCKSGLTLAFQTSFSIVAQWPLNSVRNFETVGDGCFRIEAGRRSPMGEGVYMFETKQNENDVIYHLMDKYITETIKENRKSSGRDEKIYEEYCDLGVLAITQSDLRYSRDLKRISANNFNLNPGSSAEGASNILRSGASDASLPEYKISDLEEWLEEPSLSSQIQDSPSLSEPQTKRKTIQLPSVTRPAADSSRPANRMRPSWNQPINIKRSRSRTTEVL
ncbi:hypothetical protein EB796_023544 [Bugula neritina]|uniref:IRS-type PTB domain-containing protein n=1 Tax=Bugula neritina TaxID=10212 RepID=A0A7J7IXP6_BUGNE|nr:hypothetical protein EB796_023544 [Bugula neritina]